MQSELEQEIGAISDYIQQEEKRSGTAPAGGGGGGGPDDPHLPPPAPTSDREVWVGVQSTLKRAGAQFQRCRAVIDKLHNDCQELARANGDMVVQIRNCYSRVKRMLKPGQAANQAAGKAWELFVCFLFACLLFVCCLFVCCLFNPMSSLRANR